MQRLIEQFIFETLEAEEKESHVEPRDDKLLVEPDFSADEADAEEKDEVSAVGGAGGSGPAIAGYSLPLGMKPPGKKRKPAWMAASSGYGRAKPKKTQLNALSK